MGVFMDALTEWLVCCGHRVVGCVALKLQYETANEVGGGGGAAARVGGGTQSFIYTYTRQYVVNDEIWSWCCDCTLLVMAVAARHQ